MTVVDKGLAPEPRRVGAGDDFWLNFRTRSGVEPVSIAC